MPSGMIGIPAPAAAQAGRTTSNQYATDTLDYQRQYVPWYHSNPAYSAYLQRAKFPDITANTLRGLIGIAGRNLPQIELPASLEYLRENATPEGMSLAELFLFLVSEILQVGRIALVLDVRSDNTLYISPYVTETYTNWDSEVVDGISTQTLAMFTVEDSHPDDTESGTKNHSIEYALEQVEENGPMVTVVYKFIDGDLVEGPTPIVIQGKPVERLPVVNAGSLKNDPWPDVIPMLGISDCALDIYRHSADLTQAHFLTCNPTLFVTGVDGEIPQTVGSSVVIALSNPAATAFYPATDTSALNHINEYIGGVFSEAMNYGAALLGPSKRAAESGEALALRQAASGATLLGSVTHAASAMEQILQMASDIVGGGEVVFEANTEFAEKTLNAQDISALVSTWMSGAISHESLLENFIDAGIVNEEKTPEDEIAAIQDEEPIMAPGAEGGGEDTKTEGDIDEQEEEDEDEEAEGEQEADDDEDEEEET